MINPMRKVVYCVLLFVFWGFSCHAQEVLTTKSKKAEKFYRDATKNFSLKYYDAAVEQLKEALQTDDKFIEAWLMLAEVYMDMDDNEDAIKSYKKSFEINPDFFPGAYLNVAEMEFLQGKYGESKPDYEKYLAYNSASDRNRKLALKGIENCNFAINALKHPVPFKPVNMGPNINNELDQYWPSISLDEKTFVFTLLLPKDPNYNAIIGNRQEDFYISYKEGDEWTPAKDVGYPLNTRDNEGAQTLSADGKEMYFTACNRREGYGLCDIYYSRFNGETWTTPVNIGTPVNTRYKETQPSLSPDGHTLYYACNRPEGKGGLDIWQSSLQEDGTWTEPVNLGDSINTSGEEQSPFIAADNRTLYFSSTGLTGMGRFDLFVTRKKDDGTWSTPKNLGYPINTNHNEEGLIVNAKGTTAYYSSSREGGYGGRDIYQFDLYKEAQPSPVSYMKGTVFDAETKRPLRAHFELIDLQTAKTIMDSYSQASDGTFLISIPTGKDYALNANRQGYLFFSENFTLGKTDYTKPYLIDVPLKPIKAGEKSILRNIFFEFDKFTLKPESRIELDRLVRLLNENPSMRIEVSGHTDNTGTAEYNRTLSDNRAKAVVSYLVNAGIDAKRLSAKGYGETQPVASNETEEGKALNRRTEFTVLP